MRRGRRSYAGRLVGRRAEQGVRLRKGRAPDCKFAKGRDRRSPREASCGATYRQGDAESLAEAVRRAVALPKGASRRMFEQEFDAARIYDEYVKRVLQ